MVAAVAVSWEPEAVLGGAWKDLSWGSTLGASRGLAGKRMGEASIQEEVGMRRPGTWLSRQGRQVKLGESESEGEERSRSQVSVTLWPGKTLLEAVKWGEELLPAAD